MGTVAYATLNAALRVGQAETDAEAFETGITGPAGPGGEADQEAVTATESVREVNA